MADEIECDNTIDASPIPATPLEKSWLRAAATNAVWTGVGFGASQALRVAANLVFTRLLLPDVFGLSALTTTFIMGLHLFSDIGIGSSLVRSQREDADFQNTAWTIQVIRGFCLWFASLIVAEPAAYFFGEPRLRWLIPASAVTAVFDGLNSTSLVTLTRRFDQRRRVILDLVAQILSLVCTFCWIRYVAPSVWGFVFGGVASSMIQAIGSHLLIPGGGNRVRWDSSAAKEIFGFGRWIFLSTACMFLADQADRLVFARLLGNFAELGVYQIAVQLVALPYSLTLGLCAQLLFPVYSKLHRDDVPLGEAFQRIHPFAAGFGAVLISGVIGAGPTMISCLYDERYEGAGAIAQVLAVGTWLRILEATGSTPLWALGRSRTSAFSNLAKLASLPILIIAGWRLGGFWGVLIGFAAAEFVRYLNNAYVLCKFCVPVFIIDIGLSLSIAFTGGAILLLEQHNIFSHSKWWRLLEELSAGTTLWGIAYLVIASSGLLRHSRVSIGSPKSRMLETDDLEPVRLAERQ